MAPRNPPQKPKEESVIFAKKPDPNSKVTKKAAAKKTAEKKVTEEKPAVEKPVNSGKRWTAAEDRFLASLRAKSTQYDEICIPLGRTALACRLRVHHWSDSRRIELGLIAPAPTPEPEEQELGEEEEEEPEPGPAPGMTTGVLHWAFPNERAQVHDAAQAMQALSLGSWGVEPLAAAASWGRARAEMRNDPRRDPRMDIMAIME